MMKHFIIFAVTTISILCISCRTYNDKTSEKTITSFDEIAGKFAEPPAEYGSAPLWVWNTEITKEMLETSLNDLKAKGFGGVFIHPRPGLITEYIANQWFELCRHAVNVGKQLGMYVWIYDENSYPSGFAGGHVPAQMPESGKNGALAVNKHEAFPDEVPNNLFVCFKKENDKYREIPPADYAAERGKKGEYYLLNKADYGKSPWFGGYSYVDLLYPGVTEKFIEVTIDGYKRALGDEFGKTVPGWFTDEPNINPPGALRWTKDLPDVFRNKWGYDLKENLPSLFAETGDWKRVRHNYTQTLLQMFIDRFAKICYEYCEANNLKFTGHYWEHGWPDMVEGGDNMAMYAWHQMPGIDMLFNQYNDESPQAQFGNVRSVKELASVANQTGRRRTLCETYGAGGWEETFRDFKRLGDWEYALGVNFMNQHIANLSIAGARKYDHPPVFSAHSPWWQYYGELNQYFARLSMALSAGEQVNDLLIIEPTTSIWMYYAYRFSNQTFRETGNVFQRFVTAFEKAQIEYDLGSENIIKDRGKVRKNKFVIGQREYSKVIIPPMTENLDAPTFALLKKFASGGGTVVAYSQPSYVDGSQNKEIQEFFADTEKVTLRSADKHDFASVASPDVKFTLTSGVDNLYHHRRIMEDGQILFLANVSLTETALGTVELKGADAVELHALSGKLRDYPETAKDGRISLTYNLPPAGSLLLYICNDKKSGYAPQPAAKAPQVEIAATAPVAVSPETDNVLTIDFCDLTVGNEKFSDLHFFDAADKAFKHHGFRDGNPWSTSVQYKKNIVERDTFSTGGFIVTYRFTVASAFDFSEMQAVVENAELYEITLNGKPVKPSGAWWLDRQMGVCPIGKQVQKGENLLVLKLSPMKVHAEIEPVYIRGKFSVTPAAKGWTLNPPQTTLAIGSWKEQGMPFYAGTVTYSKRYDIADPSKRHFVCLDQWTGTVAEVTVNGKSAGTIAFEPYIADVSKLLQKGENTIVVKVVGSNKNLLGPFHNNPAPGITGPWHFRNVKVYPSGKDYQQLDYGLMNDFSVKTD
ncbi:MAG: hypothetical protein LBD59_11775 [Prevotellaceae bacterium]|jgi:hypothetical protein|nr:hypothetical protein [Prevotellaceae bacterium]